MEEKPTHISYKEYQQKTNKNSNDGIAIFVSAFFILLLLFLGIAKQISPDIDVSIGNGNTSDSETVGIEKNSIDERLKVLQQEDNKENEMFNAELDEKVVLPEQKEQDEENLAVEKEATPKPSETASPEPKVNVPINPTPAAVSKVVVGYYSTKEQAEVAKSIIAESGLNISPFVRSVGGAYTIQVGSYSSREKAQSLVNDLLRNNYPARIISE